MGVQDSCGLGDVFSFPEHLFGQVLPLSERWIEKPLEVPLMRQMVARKWLSMYLT